MVILTSSCLGCFAADGSHHDYFSEDCVSLMLQ